MKETIQTIEDLQTRINEAMAIIDFIAIQKEITDLNARMSVPGFWDDVQKATAVSRQLAFLQDKNTSWHALASECVDLLALAQADQEALDVNMRHEIDTEVKKLQKRFEKMELSLLLSDTHDSANAIISLHAGAGGDDAQDWAEILLRMYSRWAELHECHSEILDITRGSIAGIKSVTIRVIGPFTFGQLKGEHGVHRLVRLSPFNSDNARHTSFALVEVLPELEKIDEVVIDEKDLRIDTFAASGKGGQSVNTTNSAVRIVHEPTGISVSCQNERSQQQNKEMAMKILHAKLQRLATEERVEHIQDLKGEHREAAWGNQIRSYVLHPYKMVKDLRTEYEESNPDTVLDGQLDGFIEAYLRWQYQEKE